MTYKLKSGILWLALLVIISYTQVSAQSIALSEKGYVDLYYVYREPVSYVTIPVEKKVRMRVNNIRFIPQEPINNMSSGVLRFRAWTIMGELIMHPTFIWSINKDILVGNKKFVNYKDISKYPDLVKRYKAIKPISLDAFVWMDLIQKNDNGKLLAKERVFFKITNNDVLIYPSEQLPYSVPTAPLNSGEGMLLNSDQTYLNGPLAERFRPVSNSVAHNQILIKATEVYIDNYINASNIDLKIKWPLDAIDDIANTFKEYESGKKHSPLDEVNEASGNIDRLAKYRNNDFWSKPSEADVKVSLNKDWNNTQTEDGVIELSGTALGPGVMIKKGKIIAKGYQQDFEVNSDGTFANHIVLGAGVNNIQLIIGSKVITQKITLKREPVDLRATLTWNTPNSDIDLHMTDPDDNECYYERRSVSNMNLDVDNQHGFGPENIYVKKVNKGSYNITVKNYKNGTGTEATIYIYINEQFKEMKKIKFVREGEIVNVSTYTF